MKRKSKAPLPSLFPTYLVLPTPTDNHGSLVLRLRCNFNKMPSSCPDHRAQLDGTLLLLHSHFATCSTSLSVLYCSALPQFHKLTKFFPASSSYSHHLPYLDHTSPLFHVPHFYSNVMSWQSRLSSVAYLAS